MEEEEYEEYDYEEKFEDYEEEEVMDGLVCAIAANSKSDLLSLWDASTPETNILFDSDRRKVRSDDTFNKIWMSSRRSGDSNKDISRQRESCMCHAADGEDKDNSNKIDNFCYIYQQHDDDTISALSFDSDSILSNIYRHQQRYQQWHQQQYRQVNTINEEGNSTSGDETPYSVANGSSGVLLFVPRLTLPSPPPPAQRHQQHQSNDPIAIHTAPIKDCCLKAALPSKVPSIEERASKEPRVTLRSKMNYPPMLMMQPTLIDTKSFQVGSSVRRKHGGICTPVTLSPNSSSSTASSRNEREIHWKPDPENDWTTKNKSPPSHHQHQIGQRIEGALNDNEETRTAAVTPEGCINSCPPPRVIRLMNQDSVLDLYIEDDDDVGIDDACRSLSYSLEELFQSPHNSINKAGAVLAEDHDETTSATEATSASASPISHESKVRRRSTLALKVLAILPKNWGLQSKKVARLRIEDKNTAKTTHPFFSHFIQNQ